MSSERPVQRSSGGIVSRGGVRSERREIDTSDVQELMRGWRRRWTSGVAIATTRSADNGMRGITLTAVMPLSLEPPSVVFALASDGEFLRFISDTRRCCIQVLNRHQEFLSERFAGRAPLPDSAFGGVPHQVIDGVPVLDNALAWAIGDVERIDSFGDHVLVVVRVTSASIEEDTDDPLLSYEGRYRGLEAS